MVKLLRYNVMMIRVLIVGAGDIAQRLFPLLTKTAGAVRVYALVRNKEQALRWRARGAIPLLGDLDDPASLKRFANVAHTVFYLAPPRDNSPRDLRLRQFLAVRARVRSLSQRWVYVSTTGVYGDRAGAFLDETAPVHPQSARALRRADAELCLRQFGGQSGRRVSILRVPGIYAADRLPLDRLQRATPAILHEEDSYSNHIHADDLAQIILATLRRGKANRIYNAVDNSSLKMGEYFDLVATNFGLPSVPRISRQEAMASLPPSLLSFMTESRRLLNRRLHEELQVRLLYPQVSDGLRAAIFSRGE